jgi:hypothetical protein
MQLLSHNCNSVPGVKGVRVMGQDTGPNGAVGVMVQFVLEGTSGFEKGGISLTVEEEDVKGFVWTCPEEVFCSGDMTKLSLPAHEVSLESPKDLFALFSILSIGVDLSTYVIEGLDYCWGSKIFKNFPEQVKSVPIPPKIHAYNLFFQESLPHAIHSKALAEVDEVVDRLTISQEGDGMVVITVRFILVFVDPVENCTDGWVSGSWDNCPLGFFKFGDVLLFCYGGKFCCRELRHSDWTNGKWCQLCHLRR